MRGSNDSYGFTGFPRIPSASSSVMATYNPTGVWSRETRDSFSPSEIGHISHVSAGVSRPAQSARMTKSTSDFRESKISRASSSSNSSRDSTAQIQSRQKSRRFAGVLMSVLVLGILGAVAFVATRGDNKVNANDQVRSTGNGPADSSRPTPQPTSPTARPTFWQSGTPSNAPTLPTLKPTFTPTTRYPTRSPSSKPTVEPTIEYISGSPSSAPTEYVPVDVDDSDTVPPTSYPTFEPSDDPQVCVAGLPFHLIPPPGCVSLGEIVKKGVQSVMDQLQEAMDFLDDFCEHEHHMLHGAERDAMKTSVTMVKEVLGQMKVTSTNSLRSSTVDSDELKDTLFAHKASVCLGDFTGEEIISGHHSDFAKLSGTEKKLHHGGCSQIPLDPRGKYSVFSFSVPAILATPLCPAHLTQFGHTMSACVVVGNCGEGKPVVAFAANKGVATCASSSTPLAAAVGGGLMGGLLLAPNPTGCFGPGMLVAAPIFAALPSLGTVAATPIGGAAAFAFSPSGKGLESFVEVWKGVGQPFATVKAKANVAAAAQLAVDTSFVVPVLPYARVTVSGESMFSLFGSPSENTEGVLDIVHNHDEGELVTDLLGFLTKDVMMLARGEANVEIGLSSLIPWFPKLVLPLVDAQVLTSLAPAEYTGVPRGIYVTARNNHAAAQAVQTIVRPLLRSFGEIVLKLCGVSADDIADNGDFNDVHSLFALTSNGASTGFRLELPLLTSIFDNAPFDLLDNSAKGTFVIECEVKYSDKALNCAFAIDGTTMGQHFVSIVQEGVMIVVHAVNELFELAQDGSDVLIAIALDIVGEFHECTIGALQEGNLDDCVIFEAPVIQQTAEFILQVADSLLDNLLDWAGGSGSSWCGISTVTDALECGTKKVTSAALCGVKNVPDALHCGVDFIESAAHCGVTKLADAAHCGIEVITSAPKCGVDVIKNAAKCGTSLVKCGTEIITDAAICGVDFLADAAVCGVKQVTNIAKCGAELITDAAKCGVDFIESAAHCGVSTLADAAHCGIDVVTDGAKCGFDTFTSIVECGIKHFQCGTQLVTSAAKCGTHFAASAAVCGVKTVTNVGLCGAELVTDGAICGFQTVTSIAKCGLEIVNCLNPFTGCAATCSVPLSCERAKTCSVAKKCDIPNTCEEPIMCDKPATCTKPKTCSIPKSCQVPNKCNVARTCEQAKTCSVAKSCDVPRTCDRDLTCEEPLTCEVPKSCEVPKECNVPNKCDVPNICEVIQECLTAETCQINTKCTK